MNFKNLHNKKIWMDVLGYNYYVMYNTFCENTNINIWLEECKNKKQKEDLNLLKPQGLNIVFRKGEIVNIKKMN